MTAQNKHIYNSRTWQRLRTLKLQTVPFCEPCEARGKLVVATVVDHKIAIEKGGDPFPPLSGLTSMCCSCHSTKTLQVERYGQAHVIKGHGLDGLPLDANHSFFKPGVPLRTATAKNQNAAARKFRLSFLRLD